MQIHQLPCFTYSTTVPHADVFYKLFNFAEPAAWAEWIMLQVFEEDILHEKDGIRVDGPGPWYMFLTQDVRVIWDEPNLHFSVICTYDAGNEV